MYGFLWNIFLLFDNNRDRIKCFVESIPVDLYQQIYDKLEEYKEYEKDWIFSIVCLGYVDGV